MFMDGHLVQFHTWAAAANELKDYSERVRESGRGSKGEREKKRAGERVGVRGRLCNKLLAKTKCKLHIYIDEGGGVCALFGRVSVGRVGVPHRPARRRACVCVSVCVCTPQTRCRRALKSSGALEKLFDALAKLFCKYLFSICCCCRCFWPKSNGASTQQPTTSPGTPFPLGDAGAWRI